MSSNKAHALLSPSASERWLACPPSARLNEQYEDTTSIYAAEGTLAHAFGELFLQRALKLVTLKTFNAQLEGLRSNALYYKGMEAEVQEYVDYVLSVYNEAKQEDPAAEIFIEQRLDISAYAPKCFGTGDAIVLSKDYVHVIDLKFGKGVAVEADDNPQLKLYGLGAAEEYGFLHDIKEIRVTIAQVRLGNLLTFKAPAKDVIAWGADYVRPRAQLAFDGEGDFAVGGHCRFCKHGALCKARAKHYEEAYTKAKDTELSNAELAQYLGILSGMIAWADALKELALTKALLGETIPQWKVVEGRSVRRITDEPATAGLLKAEGFTDVDIYKLRGLTDLEKLVGKKRFAELTQDYIEKPPGKPTLAPETDKRPALDLVSDGLEFDN